MWRLIGRLVLLEKLDNETFQVIDTVLEARRFGCASRRGRRDRYIVVFGKGA